MISQSRKLFVIQPSFLPWYGQFSMMCAANKVIFLDDVQYDKNGWRNRNRIIGPNGEFWITVPVISKNKSHQKISEVQINYSKDWVSKVLKSISNCYSNSLYFYEFFPTLEKILQQKITELSELNIKLYEAIFDLLNMEFRYDFSSSYTTSLDKVQRIIDLCNLNECEVYLSGQAAKKYIKPKEFELNKIEIQWYTETLIETNYKIYPNLTRRLSILDLLFNTGSVNSRNLILSQSTWEA